MICKICGKNLKSINNFHLASHNLSCDEYKKLFSVSKLTDDDVCKARGAHTAETHTGSKRSAEAKKKMSDIKKKQIAAGEFVTPFMIMDKYGKNNPAYGLKYHSKEEIAEIKSKVSSIMTDFVLNGGNNRWYLIGRIYSSKLARDIRYRSSYELRMISILEVLDCVIHYSYEDIRIPYNYKGTTFNYIPDFIIEFYDGEKVLVEVGPYKLKAFPEGKEKAKAVASKLYCKNNNLVYAIASQYTLDSLENNANWVNCWKDLKPFFHNVIGNDRRDGLKNEGIYSQSAAKLLNDGKSMEKVQRSDGDVHQQISHPRVPDTKVMI